jgi:hypothetical protein
MTKRIYFDTVAFREIGKAFEKTKLAADLRERILGSPITAFEVLSQLSITNADEVLGQIHGLHNWCVPEGTGLLERGLSKSTKLGAKLGATSFVTFKRYSAA